MLDILHIADTQSYDVKTYLGNGLTAGENNLTDWVQWTKPRGIKFIYIIGLGGGGSGGGSDNTANSPGGGGGGGSGAQTCILLPEMFIPDVLYIQAGAGGKGLLLNSDGLDGSDTFIAIEPYETFTPNLTLLRARGGQGGRNGPAAGTALGGIGGLVSTIEDMPLCRGAFTSLAGQTGGNGGSSGAGNAPDIDFPVNGLMVTGGAGGGGNGTGGAGGDGGSIIKPATLGETYFRSILGGARAQGSNNGGVGGNGYSANFNIINVGGAGGGGGASGGNRSAGIGGDAAPGCGGGGTGGGSTSNPVIKGGEGGPGYVMILCW